MKKRIAYWLFLLSCMAGIIFLLLPFLETTPPATTELKSGQPQVSSSNPLATIARRLASLFGKPGREQKSQPFSAQANYDYTQPSWVMLPDTPQTRAAQRPNAPRVPAELTPDGQQVAVPPVAENEYGDASLRTEDGEWVLIRQTAPQNGATGMHEVNVHENPYDRYMKQERARRFQPPTKQTAIPDSKWARLLRPVKEFFGISGARPAENSSLALYRENDAARGNTSLSLGKNTSLSGSGRTRIPWPDITPAQWARMSEADRQRERERRSTAEFIDILSGTRAAEEAAAIEAEAKYPDPKDKDKRESYRQRLTEENKQAIKEGLLAIMEQKAQEQKTVDELSYIMTGCSNSALPKPDCNPEHKEEAGSLFSSDEVTAWQDKSRQTFFDKTQYVMPNGLPLLPVLGPTEPETIANMSGADSNVEKTIDIYKFLYEENNCASQDCYWIPNTIQSNEQLRDAFKLANTTLVTDPDNFYQPLEDKFANYQVEQARKQQTDNSENALNEDEIRKQAKKQFTDNAANWIPVVGTQLNDIYQKHTLQAADPRNPQTDASLAVLYLTNPRYAPQLYHILGDSPIFGYAQQPLNTVQPTSQGLSPTQMDKQVTENTADLTLNSLADNTRDAFQVMGEKTKHSVSEGARSGMNQITTQFNQSGQNWGDLFKTMQNRNTRTQHSGKK